MAKNEVVLSGGQKLQVQLLNELDKAAEEMGQGFSDYGKKCMVNAIAALVLYCKNEGCELSDFDSTLLRLAVQNIGYTELNIAALPSECYPDIRKSKNGKKTIVFKPQGAGNEKLVRKYGVGVAELLRPYIIHEGDEFEMPSYNGTNVNPPVFKPKLENMSKKVMAVCYPLIKTDGSTEYLIATREGIKPNIIAQIRQICLYKPDRDKIYDDLNRDAEQMTVDELLSHPKWGAIINPTYTSGGSKESMILRKMANNALKNYPKEYESTVMKQAVESMFEDREDSLNENVVDAQIDPVEKVEKEINQEPSTEPVPDFDCDGVQVDKVDKVAKDATPTPTPAPDNYGF